MVKFLIRNMDGFVVGARDVPPNQIHKFLNELTSHPLEYIEVYKGGELDSIDIRSEDGRRVLKEFGKDFDYTVIVRRVEI